MMGLPTCPIENVCTGENDVEPYRSRSRFFRTSSYAQASRVRMPEKFKGARSGLFREPTEGHRSPSPESTSRTSLPVRALRYPEKKDRQWILQLSSQSRMG